MPIKINTASKAVVPVSFPAGAAPEGLSFVSPEGLLSVAFDGAALTIVPNGPTGAATITASDASGPLPAALVVEIVPAAEVDFGEPAISAK